tara:strand:+ start:118 stop:423 length:306 start_codon:yes stop_codon:yes gene_type:complete
MANNKIIKVLEYLSLFMVLSFFLFHNIYIVLLGLILSIFTINKNTINSYIEHNQNKNIEEHEENADDEKTKELIKDESVLSLVEKIEELGFIPSKDDNCAV